MKTSRRRNLGRASAALFAAAAFALSPLGAWAQRAAPVSVGGISVLPAPLAQVSAVMAFLDTPAGRRFIELNPDVRPVTLAPTSWEAQLFVGALRLPEPFDLSAVHSGYEAARRERSAALTQKLARARRDLAQNPASHQAAAEAARSARAALSELPGFGADEAAENELRRLDEETRSARGRELDQAASRARSAARTPAWHLGAFAGGDAATGLRHALLRREAGALRPGPQPEFADLVKAIDEAHRVDVVHLDSMPPPEIEAALARAAGRAATTVRLIVGESAADSARIQALSLSGVQVRVLENGQRASQRLLVVLNGVAWTPRRSLGAAPRWSQPRATMLDHQSFSLYASDVWDAATDDLSKAASSIRTPPGGEADQPRPERPRAASLSLRPGDYLSANGFRISVSRDSTGVYRVRADGVQDGRPMFVAFELDAKSGEVAKTGGRRRRFTLTGSASKGGILQLSYAYGGKWQAYDERLTLGVDPAKGVLRSLGATTRVARWSLPSGWHSGPIKLTLDDFSAEGIRYLGDASELTGSDIAIVGDR